MEGGVTDLVRMFEESEDATRDARKLAERDIDYRDGKQWTSDEENELKKRKQPVVTYNRIQRKIDYLSGLERQQRKDPKAFPRNPDDEDAANAATDSIRFVCDTEKWDEKRSAAWDDLLTPGTCAIMVGHKQTKKGIDPALIQIAWDRYFHDPHSARPDLSDKSYDGIVTWYDLDVALRRWPDRQDVLNSTLESVRADDTYDDKPKERMWADAKRRRVRVVEMYYIREGVWYRCVFTKAGHLEDPQPSPYMDEEGNPENPIKSTSLYVDRDNNRFGAVRVMISPQDEINKRRSKGLHLITMRQARVSLSAAADKEKIRRELARPDGLIDGDKDDFEILPTADMARGNFEMLMEAKAEIDLLGANAALAGKNENDLSGRAILAQQQGGLVEVARMFDRLRSLSIAVYRAIWNRIRQFWNEERWIRVTDDERNLRFVGLNQKITVKMLAQEVMQGDQQAIQKASQLVGPQMLQAALQGDEQAGMALGLFVQQNGNQVVEVRNAVNELDVDIVIDEGMDTPTVQAEQFETIAKLMANAPALQANPGALEFLVEASALRNKDKLLDILNQGPPPEQVQAQQQMQQLQMAGAEAEVEKTKSETLKNVAQAQAAGTPEAPQQADPVEQARVMLEGQQTQIDGFRAETERMEALKPDNSSTSR
jgi:hypothetical protein